MPNLLLDRLLLAAHLLIAFFLSGVFIFLVYQGRGGNLPIILFWTWELLTLLLLAWVVGLLGWRLWQRRWGRLVGLALLVGIDGLVVLGYHFLFAVAGMAAGPN
ncbi:TM2 domain-containing membrane protein YozV [Hymenobacter sp. UYP22]